MTLERAATMTRGFRVRKKSKMAATMTPDIREGAATMTRGFRVHKKKQDGGPNDT